jgi:hypothetical protein
LTALAAPALLLSGSAVRDAVRLSATVVSVRLSAAERVSAAAARLARDVTRAGASVSAAGLRVVVRDVVAGASALESSRDAAVPAPPERDPAAETESTALGPEVAGPADEDDSTPLSALATPASDPTRDQPISAAPMPADAAPSFSHRCTGSSAGRRCLPA